MQPACPAKYTAVRPIPLDDVVVCQLGDDTMQPELAADFFDSITEREASTDADGCFQILNGVLTKCADDDSSASSDNNRGASSARTIVPILVVVIGILLGGVAYLHGALCCLSAWWCCLSAR